MKRFSLFLLLFACVIGNSIAKVEPYLNEGLNPSKEARQGAAAYKDYFFQFHNANPIIEIFNLKTKKHLQNIELTPVKLHHCNNVNFGTSFYKKGDKFPLLYVSTEHNQRILVYRLTEKDGIFAIQPVQTIHIPKSEEMGLYFPDSFIDGKGGYLWLHGYTANSWQKPINDNHIRYIQLPLPKVSEGDVTINLNNKVKEFSMDFTYATQGVIFYKGKIIQAYGISHNTNRIRIVNPQTGKIEKEYLPHKLGMDEEPEAMFLYKGKPMIATIHGHLFYVNQFKDK